MATIDEIATRIKTDLVISGTAKDVAIYDSIRSAIRLMQRKRYWFLRKSANVTLSVGAASVAVPTDFALMETVDLTYGTNRYSHNRGFNLLEFTKLKDLYFTTGAAASGQPMACSLVNNTLHLSHLTDVASVLVFDYYQKDITLPETANQTSVWLGDEGSDVIRSLAQFIYEKESMGRGDADPAAALGYQTRLDETHTFYERGAY